MIFLNSSDTLSSQQTINQLLIINIIVMAISRSEDLFSLIKSLTRSDKRAFRLYVGGSGEEKDKIFLQLFDIIDRSTQLDDAIVKTKLGIKQVGQYANAKRHLYSKILTVLRVIKKEKKSIIKIREYIDFAYVLYDKGLYMQALKILSKAKSDAIKHHADFSLITIIEIEKMIHCNHITRSKTDTVANLINQADRVTKNLSNRVALSNLRITLLNEYIKKGHIHSEEQLDELHLFFVEQIQDLNPLELDELERAYLIQSYVWYHYICLQFDQCAHYAEKWITLFQNSVELQERDVNLYLRGYHYLLNSLYHIKDTERFSKYLEEIDHFRTANYRSFSQNTKIISFLYVHIGRMNLHFLNRSYSKGLSDVARTLKRMKRYSKYLDLHKVMILNYKIAWMHLGSGDPKSAMLYIMKIINIKDEALREDIQTYARLMYLMATYDDQDFDKLVSRVKRMKRYLSSVQESNKIQILIYQLFTKLSKIPSFEHKDIMRFYSSEIAQNSTQSESKRALIYIDIVSWLKAKIENRPLSQL